MKQVKDILPPAQEIEASLKTSPIEAGRTEDNEAQLIDTINQVFSLFRINYHNQYHAAFGDTAVLNQAKRLWKEALGQFSDQLILQAAKRVIEQSDYLPTLKKMLDACEEGLKDYGLPDTRTAYLEAANKPSPKNQQDWSHPIVYHAGKTLGWYALSHVAESISYPAFEKAYRDLTARLLAGESFQVDRQPELAAPEKQKASAEFIEKELQALRDILS